MWDKIGNISAIATLVLFVAYIIGHVWRIALLKDTLQEKFELVELTDDVRDSDYYADFAEEGGQVFAVSSPNGIRHIMFFEILLDSDMQAYGKRILKEFYRVEPNQRVYAHVKIPDSCARIGVEILKNDRMKIEFGIADSGKNGALVKENYKCRMTLESWVYYLCM